MLSQTTLQKVSQLLLATANTETQTEICRQVLCENPAFEPLTAFRRVSALAQTISSNALKNFLADNDVKIYKQDASYLIRLYDADEDGKLSYPEFLDAVLPKTDAKLCNLVQDRKVSHIEEDEGLNYKVEHAIARVFEEELESYQRCEILRQELAGCDDFDLMEIFRIIDLEDEGYIDAEKIMRFMEKMRNNLTDTQLEAFMIRIDKNNDGVIRYADFLEIFYSIELDYIEEKKQISSNKISNQNPDQNQDVQHKVSPAKKEYGSATKMVDSTFSPYSTKASASTNSMYKTPTKSSANQVANEDIEYQGPIMNQSSAARATHFEVNFSPKRESPMKRKEEQELVNGLKDILEHIHALETLKNSLALRKDFNIYNAFAIFDLETKAVINVRQLEQGLKILDVQYTKGDIALLMKRIDSDLDGLIKFEDFSQIITPRTAEFSKLLSSKQPYYLSEIENPLEAFTEETLEAFRTFLRSLIEEEALCESVRQRLQKRKSFNLHDAFKALDRYDNGYIASEQFRDMLEENGLFFSQKDVNILVDRYAKATKGKISYYDFIREMTPKSAEKY